MKRMIFLPLLLAACVTTATVDWGEFDVLSRPACPPHRALGGIAVSDVQYETFLTWGERFFRQGAYGSERSVTDVMGVLGGTVRVSCGPDCSEELAVLDVYVAALDDLDGVAGNLFVGNGAGRTSDLVLSFPPGTTLYDLPVPERVHTGLDVEAGAVWPLGLQPVATEDNADYLFNPSTWDAGPGAPEGRFRARLTCAACHYSLDIDNDGVADLDSAKRDTPTPGSPWDPADAWGVGNQDLHFGWLFALSANPLMGAVVLAGDVGTDGPDKAAKATDFVEWLELHWERDTDMVAREVIRGMLVQPRGYADVNSDASFNTMQLPPLYTRHLWPANVNGAIFDPVDRNNTVWSGALDFTGLIGLCEDRGGQTAVPGEGRFQNIASMDCDSLARMMVEMAPGAVDEAAREALITDILGTEDGIPGMLGPEGMVAIPSQGSILPDEVLAAAEKHGRLRQVSYYGTGAELRGSSLALLGYRLGLPPQEDVELGLAKAAVEVGLQPEEMVSHTLSLMMDWIEPPSNESELLAASASLVERGREVFSEVGCADCHAGPFFTDNRLVPLSEDDVLNFGSPRVSSTTGWRTPQRALGPAIETQPERATSARKIRRFASAPYDARTGLPSAASGPIGNLLRVQTIGYRTAPLRHVWGSAPYLHDGGVGVATTAEVGTDLAAHLRGVDEAVYGMGQILAVHEAAPSPGFRPDAALSLQALVLEAERERVIAANDAVSITPIGKRVYRPEQEEQVTMASVGVSGRGHAFYLDDVPGGERVTALVAFLLALDDCVGDLPGREGDECAKEYAVPAAQGRQACPETPGLYSDLSDRYAVEAE